MVAQILYSTKEVALYLKVHPNTVYQWIKEGRIPYVLINGQKRFRKTDIDRWLEECSQVKSKLKEILPKFDISLDGYDKLFLERRTELNGITRWSYPFGSVLMRKTKNKEERYYIHYQVDGQRIRKALKGVRTRAEAVKVLNAEVSDAQRGKYHFQNKKINFSEMADLYLERYAKPKKKSWKTSDWVYLRRLKPYFDSQMLAKITPLMIEEYISERLGEGLKNSSINRELSCLKKLFNCAVDWGYLSSSPLRKIKKLSEQGSMRERILSEDVEITLIEASPPHLQPIIKVALYTGFRRKAILNLTWQNVDFEKGEIRTKQSKTGEGRAVPMNSTVMSLMADQKSRNGNSEYVFANPRTGKPYVDIKNAFVGACERAGIKDFHFHDLRHTFGSRLVKSGANINLVKELMGHASIVTTQRYLHSQIDEKKKAVEALTFKPPKSDFKWQMNGKYSVGSEVSHSISAS